MTNPAHDEILADTGDTYGDDYPQENITDGEVFGEIRFQNFDGAPAGGGVVHPDAAHKEIARMFVRRLPATMVSEQFDARTYTVFAPPAQGGNPSALNGAPVMIAGRNRNRHRIRIIPSPNNTDPVWITRQATGNNLDSAAPIYPSNAGFYIDAICEVYAFLRAGAAGNNQISVVEEIR